MASSQLIEADKPLAEIAMSCGFYDQSAMTHFFKEYLKTTPSAHRKAHRRP
jgi:AraC-like DNA-binding protein